MKVIVQLKKRRLVTIPDPARSLLGLKEGDFLELDIKKIEPKKPKR